MYISVKLLNSLEHPVHALQNIAIRMVFWGVSGLYWSLQYLSVADATVLIFLTPLTTAVAGLVFLKESYSVKQAGAGGWLSLISPLYVYPTSWMWILLLLMIGVFGFVAQMLFVVVLGLLSFGVIPALLSVLGAAIIMSSALYVVLYIQRPHMTTMPSRRWVVGSSSALSLVGVSTLAIATVQVYGPINVQDER
ncbi:hypothetical protein BDR07DRAFT_1459444 [Suillus spraguei]|nr:hypothetical protein BDR07DRAFT_1459444 [Suillus spraguei]